MVSPTPRALSDLPEWQHAWDTARAASRTHTEALWGLAELTAWTAIYWSVFGKMVDVSRGAYSYLAFLVVGLLTYGLCRRVALDTAQEFRSATATMASLVSRSLVSVTLLPYEVLVLVAVLAAVGIPPRSEWLLLPGVVAICLALSLGLGIIVGVMARRWPEYIRASKLIMRIGFYASAVPFSFDRFLGHRPGIVGLAVVNPFYNVVALMRRIMTGQVPPNPRLVVVATCAWIGATALLFAMLLWRGIPQTTARAPGLENHRSY